MSSRNSGLLEQGVKKGDRVALLLSNRPEFLFAWFGLAKIGAVMVPINTGFKEKEAGYVVNHSEGVGLIFDRETIEPARDLWCNMLHLHGQQVHFELAAELPFQIVNWHERESYPSLMEAQQLFGGVA